jgi:hypothetical protein
MSQILVIPDGWLQKVAQAVGLSEDEVNAMVNRMFDFGASKTEIEQALVMMAQTRGKTLLFLHQGEAN